ncbi:MAG: helix-turn-helix domain-containing protein [Chromatiaceae bacterium]|nr:MAG: helix-turn-helix domain-containing protein [Chromatiaceae bacterium]
MLTERIINIGRRPATERLAHFLLEMKVRVCPATNEFALPLNQTVIGDALGLSAVHVSRTLRHLREQGWVEMDNGHVCLRDIDALVKLSDFNPAYLDCVSNWATQD